MKKAISTIEFDLFFKDHPVPMCMVSARDRSILDANESILKLYKTRRAAFLKRPLESLFPNHVEKIKGLKKIHATNYRKIGTIEMAKSRYQIRGKQVKFQRESCFLLCLENVLDLSTSNKRFKGSNNMIDDQIINSLPGIFYAFNEQGKFLRWNKDFERVSEYSSEEIGNMSPLDFFDDDEKGLIQERIVKGFTEGAADVEAEFRSKSGLKIPYYFTGKAMVFNGKSCLVGMGIDITKRNEAMRFRLESEERLRYIFQTEPNCIKILDSQGALIQMNESGLDMIEAEQLEQVAGQQVVNLVDEPFRKKFKQLTQSVIKGESGTLQFSITGLKGTKRWLETHAVPLKDNQSGRNMLLGVTRDITEQKIRTNLIEALSEVQQTFITQKNTQQFFDFVVEKILCLTESECGFFGEVIHAHNEPVIHTFSNVSRNKTHAPVDFNKLKELLKRLMLTRQVVLSSNLKADFNDESTLVQTFMGLPIFRGSELVGVVCLANRPGGYNQSVADQLTPFVVTLGNIIEAIRSDRFTKSIMEDLQETSRKLYLTYRASGLGIWQLDFQKKTLTGNERTVELMGLPTNVVSLDEYWQFVHPADRRKKLLADQTAMESKSQEYSSEYRIVRPSDGEVRYIKSQGLFFRDETGKPITGMSVIYDQTNDKLREEKLLSSLQEKELLIKEIHHRVKNNLQLISSMLFLKMENWENQESRDFLTSIREKIKSVSLIHERLLQTESLSTIDIKEYLQKLLHDIQITYYRQSLTLNIRTDIQELYFSTDYATYLGQLINELVVNAIIHAFENRERGEILVSLNSHGDTFELEVKDNGVGFPVEKDPLATKSYGMQLVQIFVKQLKGKLSIDRINGTRFKIEFKL